MTISNQEIEIGSVSAGSLKTGLRGVIGEIDCTHSAKLSVGPGGADGLNGRAHSDPESLR